MRIALFAHHAKDPGQSLAKEVAAFLKQNGAEVIDYPHEVSQKIDLLLSIGGDGTILRLLHAHPELLDIPLVGVNLGKLGFMADIPTDELFPSLREILEGGYRAEKRLMLDGFLPNGESCFAINDFVIHRGSHPSLVELAVEVDGVHLNTFLADGLIVATPTGSTAYSLAAGGPILTPDLEALIITPINPHTISNRPIVLRPQKEVCIQYLSPHASVEVAYDGVSRYRLHSGQALRAAISKRHFKLASLKRSDFFSTLRSKLGWSGGKRL